MRQANYPQRDRENSKRRHIPLFLPPTSSNMTSKAYAQKLTVFRTAILCVSVAIMAEAVAIDARNDAGTTVSSFMNWCLFQVCTRMPCSNCNANLSIIKKTLCELCQSYLKSDISLHHVIFLGNITASNTHCVQTIIPSS
jgi:hypothetical protein